MKLNKQLIFLLLILFCLCTILYFIRDSVFQEGLTVDTNDKAVSEAQTFANDNNFGGASGCIKILPLISTINNTNAKTGIMADYQNIVDLPIRQFAIKSSYNSCCSGENSHFISSEMLMHVLSRGCRFIDLEISNIVTDAKKKISAPYVVYPDYGATVPIDVNKCCTLDSVLKTLVKHGLMNTQSSSAGATPNYTDPLFLHLRINADPLYNNLYQDVAACIKKNLIDYLYGHANVTPTKSTLEQFVMDSVLPVLRNVDLVEKINPLNDSTTSTLEQYLKVNLKASQYFSFLLDDINNYDIASMNIYDYVNRQPVRDVLNIPLIQGYLISLSVVLSGINDANPIYNSSKSIVDLISYIYPVSKKFDLHKTTMRDIMGKIIIILDANYDENWRTAANCNTSAKNCYDLKDFVHAESGTNDITLNSPSMLSNQYNTPITVNSDQLTVTIKCNGERLKSNYMQIVLPESDPGLLNTDPNNKWSNPDFQNITTNWGCNFIAYRFYNRDTALTRYERFFNSKALGIVPLAYVKNFYLQQKLNNPQ